MPIELFPSLIGHLAFIALEYVASPIVLLHMFLQFVLREECLPTFLALEFIRHGSSIIALGRRNNKEPR